MTTVTKKPMPHPTATNLSRFLSTGISCDNFGEANRSSDVINSMMAVAASHRLMSDADKAKFIYPDLSQFQN